MATGNGYLYTKEIIDYNHFVNNNKSYHLEMTVMYNVISKYPHSIDGIALNGTKMMDIWDLKGIQIKNTKEFLLDNIYKDNILNNEGSLIKFSEDKLFLLEDKAL